VRVFLQKFFVGKPKPTPDQPRDGQRDRELLIKRSTTPATLTLPMLLMFMVSLAITACRKQLQWKQEHRQKIKQERNPFGSWLNRLFVGMGSWLKQLLKVFAIGLAVSVCILICLPCFVGCLQNCLLRMMDKSFDYRIEYHRLRKKL